MTSLKAWWASFSQQERGKRTLRWGRRLFMLGIAGWLAYQFTDIGWAEIGRSLPTHPLFYLIFLFIYFSLPVTEALIYGRLWDVGFRESFVAFLKKRVYNKDVLGYSGEVYLYLWARRHVKRPERELMGIVKDNAIVSSLASTCFAVGVLGVLFLTGQLAFTEALQQENAVYGLVVAVLVGVAAALGYRFRHTLFRLSLRVLAVLFAVHLGRLLLVNVLQVVQWAVVLPDVSLQVWFTFLAVLIVTSRIPLLPGRDLIFLGASVGLSQMMNVSAAGVAGMLLVSSMLDKGLNLLLFFVSSLMERRRAGKGEKEPETPEKAEIEAATRLHGEEMVEA